MCHKQLEKGSLVTCSHQRENTSNLPRISVDTDGKVLLRLSKRLAWDLKININNVQFGSQAFSKPNIKTKHVGCTMTEGRWRKPCDANIQRTIDLTQEMMSLADQGDADREDTGCGILYGMLRDAAYKLRRMAENEKKQHQAKGWWS